MPDCSCSCFPCLQLVQKTESSGLVLTRGQKLLLHDCMTFVGCFIAPDSVKVTRTPVISFRILCAFVPAAEA